MKCLSLNPIVLATSLGLYAAALCPAAIAGEVYQWKDAKGVTQYSSSPPPQGAFKARTIKNDGATAIVAAEPRPADNAECGLARKNLHLLEGKGAVQQDTDGDGDPDKTLSASERASQLALAQASANANCTASATVTDQIK